MEKNRREMKKNTKTKTVVSHWRRTGDNVNVLRELAISSRWLDRSHHNRITVLRRLCSHYLFLLAALTVCQNVRLTIWRICANRACELISIQSMDTWIFIRTFSIDFFECCAMRRCRWEIICHSIPTATPMASLRIQTSPFCHFAIWRCSQLLTEFIPSGIHSSVARKAHFFS